jgi:hypothetical protein
MDLPKVRHINKDKRKKKKHHYKEFDPVVIKWYGERHICFVEKLQFSRDKYPTYRVRSVTNPGCIYYDLELDDPNDPYCYVSSTLTKSLTDAELHRIKVKSDEHRGVVRRYTISTSETKKSQPNRGVSIDIDELDSAIKKQKAFINGEKFW